MTRKNPPCECGNYLIYTEDQVVVVVERECEKHNLTFLGFVGGRYVNNNTYLSLKDNVTGVTWSTTTWVSFHKHGVRRPKDLYVPSINVDKHIKDFMSTGKFLKETQFFLDETRLDSKGARSYWLYKCPKCSYDKYVEEGVCDGKFRSCIGHLKAGKLSCRCFISYRYTQDQRKFQVKMFLKGRGTFKEWVDWKGNKRSTFMWICNQDHINVHTVDSMVNRGARCRECLSETNYKGYWAKQKEENDYLYIILFEKRDYFKIGRSFDPKNRLRNIAWKYDQEGLGCHIYKVYSGTHEDVFKTEQRLIGVGCKSLFDEYRPDSVGSTEMILLHKLGDVLEYLSDCKLKEENVDVFTKKIT